MQMLNRLKLRQRQDNPIKVALLGVGQMGTGLICQCERIPGMVVVAASSRRAASCKNAWLEGGVAAKNIKESDDPLQADLLVEQGYRVILRTPAQLCQMKNIDIVVEATGCPLSGAEFAMLAIAGGKHVVQMNVEADATVGYLLQRMAVAKGVIYSLSGGDEPGAIAQLVDFALTLSLPVVCAGKGKNNILDREISSQHPTILAKAKKYRMSSKMLTSFIDGTKTMVEMASLGNAIGFGPDVPGMHGPKVTVNQISETFIPRSCGGILTTEGVVDFGFGFAPGVFVVVRVDHPKVLLDLQYLAMGDGPYYALYRPYHLVSLETPISIFSVVDRGEAVLATDRIPCNFVSAWSKRKLRAGTILADIGGDDFYGLIEQRQTAEFEEKLPLGLAPAARLIRNVSAAAPLRFADVELDEEQTLVRLYRQQQSMLQESCQEHLVASY